jgi:hypothetical protein
VDRAAAQGELARHWLRAVDLLQCMNVLDLIKATIFCGGIAFLIYSFPVVSQAVIIGVLSLLWLSYAHRTIAKLMRR